MLRTREHQLGFGVLGAILVVAIMSLVMLGYTRTAMQQQQDARIQATAASINQLASAQLNHYMDDSYKDWASDVQDLIDHAMLPAFRKVNAVGNPYVFAPSLTGLKISTEMTDQGEARRVAQALGSHADFSGATVTASYPLPGTAALLNNYVRRDGANTVTGTLVFGSNADLDLQGNELANAGTITATKLFVNEIECTSCTLAKMNLASTAN